MNCFKLVSVHPCWYPGVRPPLTWLSNNRTHSWTSWQDGYSFRINCLASGHGNYALTSKALHNGMILLAGSRKTRFFNESAIFKRTLRLSLVNMAVFVVWVVMPCGFVHTYQRCSTLKMEKICFPETLVSAYKSTGRYKLISTVCRLRCYCFGCYFLFYF
jgi:hypothetical protein